MKYNLPENFMIGTATSSFQIETPVDHQLKGLVAYDGSKLISTIDHEKRRDEDIKYISKLGNAYRFSLDWGRLQRYPFEPFQQSVVREYRKFMKELMKKGIQLDLVLHHFANPNWFENIGSWLFPKSVDVYLDYVKQVRNNFGDLVTNYETFNEPGAYAVLSHISGFFPPYKKMDIISAKKIIRNMSRSSNKAYEILKKNNKKTQVGFAKSVLTPLPTTAMGYFSSAMYKNFFINYIISKFSEIDYVGINYYGEIPMGPLPFARPDNKKKFDSLKMEHDDMWVYDPADLKSNILHLQEKYNKPIMITENGYCGRRDKSRIKFIKEHLKSVCEAIDEGADVRGYFYWSTFDNFELFLGTSFKFGLVEINYETMSRKLKESAKFYEKLVKTKSFEL